MEVLAGCPGRSQTQPRPDLQALSSAATPFSWSDCVRVQAAASGYHCPAWARVRGTQHPGKTASTRRESAATLTPPPDFVSRRQRMGSRLVGYGVLAGCLRAQTCHAPQSGLPITPQHTQLAATVWPTYQRRPQPVREVFPTAFWIEKVPCLFLSAVRIAGRKPWSTTTTPIKPVTVPSVVGKLPSPHCRRLAPRPLAGPIQHTSHPAAL